MLKKSTFQFPSVSNCVSITASPPLALCVKIFLFGSLMVLFVVLFCEWGPDRWMWAYNRRGKSSPHPHWPRMIYITVMALARCPVSHLSVYSRTEICRGTQIHSISLKRLGSLSFSSGREWCWGDTVIRGKPERTGMLSSLVSSRGFDLL